MTGRLSDGRTVATMLELWGDGLTGKQIAEQMGNGLTRNGVLGKIDRLRMKFFASQLTYETVAEGLEEGKAVKEFDRRGEPTGAFGLAEIRRGLGRQAV